jgi:hypothetical protein
MACVAASTRGEGGVGRRGEKEGNWAERRVCSWDDTVPAYIRYHWHSGLGGRQCLMLVKIYTCSPHVPLRQNFLLGFRDSEPIGGCSSACRTARCRERERDGGPFPSLELSYMPTKRCEYLGWFIVAHSLGTTARGYAAQE